MLYGAKKYKENDLPVAATFISAVKKFRVVLLNAKSTVGEDNVVRKTDDTGLIAEFEDHRLIVQNQEVVDMLLNHRNYEATRYGFTVDPCDPTGFWRALGVIKEKVVITYQDEDTVKVAPKEIDLAKLQAIDPEQLVDLTR